jgi:uncharacterized protein (TIGR02145 family)
MKNLNLLFLAIVIMVFFTKCEKEPVVIDEPIVDTISVVDTTPIPSIPNPIGSLDKSSDLNITNGGGVTDIDGNVYTTIIINNQEWMVENLRVTHYTNGEPITMSLEYVIDDMGKSYSVLYNSIDTINVVDTVFAPITDQIWWDNDFAAACYYNNEETYKYNGVLYNWYAVSNGIAPEGWHVATQTEWDDLYKYCKRNDITFNTNIEGYSGFERWNAFGYNSENYHWWTGDGVNAIIYGDGEISTFGAYSSRIGFAVICIKD